MAINFPVGSRALFNMSAAPVVAFNQSYTFMQWFKRTVDVASLKVMFTYHANTDDSNQLMYLAVDAALNHVTLGGSPTGLSPVLIDIYYWHALMQSAGVELRSYYSVEGFTGDPTVGTIGAPNSNTPLINYLTCGSYCGGGAEARASECCTRMFPFTMTLAQLKAERDSPAAVMAGALIDWRMDTLASVPVFSNPGAFSLSLFGVPTLDTDEPSNISGSSLTKYLKALVHPSAAGATGCQGAVFNAPATGNVTGSKVGEFASKTFLDSSFNESGQAVLKIPVTSFGGAALAVGATPVLVIRNSSTTTGMVNATVIEE